MNRILVVEDDTSIRNLITTTLKTNDYRYVVAMNGKMALTMALRFPDNWSRRYMIWHSSILCCRDRMDFP